MIDFFGIALELLSDFFFEASRLFLEMAPYLLLGLTVVGFLNILMKREFIARQIGRPGALSTLKAALLGVPLPLCSCSVVPTASYLKKSGASRPALQSFLISTPQTGVDSIIATWGMLGPFFAVFRAVVALVTGIIGGFLSVLFGEGGGSSSSAGYQPSLQSEEGEEDDEHEHSHGDVCGHCETDYRTPAEGPRTLGRRMGSSIRSILRYGYGESVDDIALPFLIGLVISGAISMAIPDNFFAGTFFASGLPAMLLMVAISVPMYVCSTSSIPVAVALIAKGLSPGAAYVFLVAGPATNAATLSVLAKVLGRKQTILYVLTIVGGSMIFGPLMDFLYRSGVNLFGWAESAVVSTGGGVFSGSRANAGGQEMQTAGGGAAAETAGWPAGHSYLELVLGAVLLSLLVAALFRRFSAHKDEDECSCGDECDQAGHSAC